MTAKDVFEKLRAALEAAAVPYFVSGSFASSAHGIPRSTNDIDIVISPTRAQLVTLLAQFPASEYGKSEEDAFDAFNRRLSFNIVDYATFWKIDFILRQLTPFDASRFKRCEVIEIAGVRIATASADGRVATADQRCCRDCAGSRAES